MRKLFTLILVVMVCAARGQTTYTYRYWFDANSDKARQGSIVGKVLPLQAPVDTLPDWYHLIHFQVRDNAGLWSPTYTKPFVILPAITASNRDLTGQTYRYWFDANSDKARQGIITGNVLPLQVSVDTLPDWYHLIHFQVRDDAGLWSPTYTKPFVILPAITAPNRDLTGQTYRYWFDANSDKARQGTITGNVLPIQAPVDTLADWYHLIHFQVRDDAGLWSPTYTKPFVILPAITASNRDLTGQTYRYWFDANSNAAREGTITSNVLPLKISVDTLPDWYHLLHFQVRDDAGLWSPTYTKPFVILPTTVVANRDLTGQSYRYWFDEDGASLTTGTLTGNVMTLNLPITSLDAGEHTLSFQVQDDAGHWSPIRANTFLVYTNGLTVVAGEGGTVTYKTVSVRDGVQNYAVHEGVPAELTITPDEGYDIQSVMVDDIQDITNEVFNNTVTVNLNAAMAMEVTFELTDFMKLGDVNNDNRISVADLSLTVAHLIGEQPQVFVKRQADANNDGEINVGDLARIVDVITGAVARGTHDVKQAFSANEGTSADMLTGMLTDGGIDIGLQNQTAYTTFQMALTLPAGTDIADVRLAPQRKNNHALAKGWLEDGRLRVVVYSADNSPLLGSDGPLLEIQTSAAITEEVLVDDIVFVNTQGRVRKMAPFRIGTANGVNGTKATTTFDAKYDLGGRRITGKPHRGIYIIDGKTIIFQ